MLLLLLLLLLLFVVYFFVYFFYFCFIAHRLNRLFNFLEQCVMAPGVVCERGLDAHFRERALSVAKQLLSPVASLEMLDAVLEVRISHFVRRYHEEPCSRWVPPFCRPAGVLVSQKLHHQYLLKRS